MQSAKKAKFQNGHMVPCPICGEEKFFHYYDSSSGPVEIDVTPYLRLYTCEKCGLVAENFEKKDIEIFSGSKEFPFKRMGNIDEDIVLKKKLKKLAQFLETEEYRECTQLKKSLSKKPYPRHVIYYRYYLINEFVGNDFRCYCALHHLLKEYAWYTSGSSRMSKKRKEEMLQNYKVLEEKSFYYLKRIVEATSEDRILFMAVDWCRTHERFQEAQTYLDVLKGKDELVLTEVRTSRLKPSILRDYEQYLIDNRDSKANYWSYDVEAWQKEFNL